MKIQVYLSDGKTYDFVVQGEEESKALIASLKPATLFEQRILQIQGVTTTVSINPAAIESIHFMAAESLKWPVASGAGQVQLISPETYESRCTELNTLFGQREEGSQGENVISVVAVLMFRSGRSLHIQVDFTLEPGDDRRRHSLNLFESPFFPIMREDGTTVLVNPKNVNVIKITPGPQEPSPFTWKAELQGG